MNALERLLVATLVLIALAAGGWLGLQHYGAEQYQAGWDGAVAAGKKQRDSDAVAALAIESGLRTRLLEQDTIAFRKEQEYATNLEAAQRRVRAGTDRLQCPAANPVQPGAAPGDRPAAAGLESNGAGPAIVPEVAAEILGDGAAIAGIVRRFERLEQRFDACQAVNAK